ncbi:nitronate monooxygenase [Flavobacterium araucananum]|uniref:Propionate 3-nitronate monooxygenase n=1 Tax=Flavobacterium araucananum TaxID=946678 RepID=A0A227PHN9_9FLAO|nr:nitronate monooxygenase [Flavobacterium araucananum]OXG09063.1 2-nitropropane dioxygenase [Flavobacterium araucananum]PWJ99746.1 nitronate monooxygenase [Flavobacterium araucananum]
MWYTTKATALLGIDYPIMQGPFGGNLSTVELTAAVSNAGGLGGYGAYTMSAQEIFEADKQLKAATNKPYNINLWVSDHDISPSGLSDEEYNKTAALFKPYFDEVGIPLPEKPAPFQSRFKNQLEVILDIKPKVFSFMFGVPPQDVLEQCRRSGIVTVGAATTLDEAIFLEAAGVDMIIASGFEAGGHRPSFLAPAESSLTGTFVLLQLIREKVKTPIIAAGGIANGKGVAAALALGSSAAQVGTAFLACDESNALPIHREMLFSDAAKYTTLSRAYTGRLGRGLTSRIATKISGAAQDILPFPLQTTLISPLRKAALDQQKWDMILFWGGQIAPILKHTKAKELMHSLIEETNAYFDDLKG